MNPTTLAQLSAAIMQTGAPVPPTALLLCDTPIYEVDFTALEFTEESELHASDWAVLALARALGVVDPEDVDAYLGLGEVVSQVVMHRLLEDHLLVQCSTDDARQEDGPESGLLKRLLSRMSRAAPSSPDVTRQRTQARTLHAPRAPASPRCQLTAAGLQALDRGVVIRRRERPARLRFLAEPLLFLDVEDERTHSHVQHKRAAPLLPERVPQTLRRLDEILALAPAHRMAACGIDTGIVRMKGNLIGVVPGSQWEVRPASGHRGQTPPMSQQSAQIILAAFAQKPAGSLHWRSYRKIRDLRPCENLEPIRLLPPASERLEGLLSALAGHTALPDAASLRSDGALNFRCGSERLPALLGEADRPGDTLLPISLGQWWAGLRVHGQPADIEAGRSAYFEFLRRHDMDLRKDFDGTCVTVAAQLIQYWNENPGLPSIEESATTLWRQAEMRAALCNRRLREDLTTAYAAADETK